MRNVYELLKENKELKDFVISEEKKESFELFFVSDKLETVRKTDTLDTKITVYVKNNETLGNYSFSLLSSDNKNTFEKKLNEAIKNAKLVNNKDYELPAGNKSNHNLKSNIKDYSYLELANKINEIVIEAKKETNAKINALEVFINKRITKIINSQGVNRKMNSYDVFIEAIPTYHNKNESYELYEAISFGEFDELKLKEEIVKSLNNVKARANAKDIKLPDTIDVLLNIAEVRNFFMRIKANLNYSSLYSRYSIYELNQKIIDNAKADKITMKATSKLKGSNFQRPFDEDGVLLSEKKLIENNKVVGFYGSNRFAQYLGKEVTGNLPCFIVKKGTLDTNDLKNNQYLECISFSGLQVDLYQDYIGGEVRLGLLKDKNNIISVSGFTISGKVSDVLKDLHLSKDIDLYQNYKGPKYLLIKNMKIC